MFFFRFFVCVPSTLLFLTPPFKLGYQNIFWGSESIRSREIAFRSSVKEHLLLAEFVNNLKAANLEEFYNALFEEFVLVLGVNNFFYFGEQSVVGGFLVVQIKY